MRLKDILKDDSNLYLIDLSFCLHRFFHSHSNLTANIEGYSRPVGHIYGLFQTIMLMRNMDPGCTIIITQDGEPVERNRLMAESGQGGYKEGRPELEFNFYQDIPLLKASLCLLSNVYWAFDADKESDDAMYALSREAESIPTWKGKTYIYSGDNDLLQSIDDRTFVIRHKGTTFWDVIDSNVVQTADNFVKKFHGVDPSHLVYFRSITGDSSDKIRGIPRFPRDIAFAIAMATEEGNCHFTPMNSRETKWFATLQEEQATVVRNYKLMKLYFYEATLSKPVINRDKVLALLDKYKLISYKNYLVKEL